MHECRNSEQLQFELSEVLTNINPLPKPTCRC
jgi:hypothetical protein